MHDLLPALLSDHVPPIVLLSFRNYAPTTLSHPTPLFRLVQNSLPTSWAGTLPPLLP